MARRRRRVVIRDRKKLLLRLLLFVIGVIALAGAILLTVFTVRSCGISLSTRTLPIDPGGLVCGTGDGLLYVRSGMLNFFSYKDEDLNFPKFLSSSPTGLVGAGSIRAVYSDSSIQIIDAPFDIQAKGYIRAVRAGTAHIAVCMRKADGSELVTVYSGSGHQVYELEFGKGRLVDFGFSEYSGQTLWTMELTVDSGSPRTTVTTFDLERMSATGVITVYDQLVEQVFFTESSVFVVGTESLIRYSAASNREIYRVRLHGYSVIDRSIGGESLNLLLIPRNTESLAVVRVLTVAMKDVAGETAVTLTLDPSTVACYLTNSGLVTVGENEVRLLTRRGEVLETLATPVGTISAANKLDEKHILIERSGEFDLLTIGK